MAEPDPPAGPEPQNPPDRPTGNPPAPPTGDPDPAAEVAKWKALARQHERRAKEGQTAIDRLAELENRDKTELERAQSTARQATERADKAELEVLRLQVAARKGLTAEQAKRLQGTTAEELDADADELLAAFKPPEPPPAPPANGSRQGTPVPRLRPGAVPDAGTRETDPAKLAALVPRR